MAGTQEATHEPLTLLQNNDVAVTVDLEISDTPVPDWDLVTVEVIIETPLGSLLKSSATSGVDLVAQSPVDTGPTGIMVSFGAGELSEPTIGTYVVDVIHPDSGRLTYRWGGFRVVRTRADGTASGWSPYSALASLFVASGTIRHLEHITRAVYDLLDPPDPETFYVVEEP